MLYVGSNDATKPEFTNSVRICFDVKFLGPAQRFLQMHSHQQKDTTRTLDQHCYVLNTSLQHHNANSKFPERATPFPPDFTFSKDNQPVTDHDKQAHFEEQCKRLPFCFAVCTPLDLAYNTFAFFKLAKPAFIPGISTSVLSLSGL
jgi:hypothetical protein